MKKIESLKFLELIEYRGIKGSMPSMIRYAVYSPRHLKQEDTVLFDRFERVDINSIGRYPSCVIVTEDLEVYKKGQPNTAIILVDHVEAAYWKFVNYYRSQFQIPVIAVTGTCGKSTTKEMIKHILSNRYQVQATIGSKNADSFNLPYLLGMDQYTDVGVFETAVSKPGDLLDSCKYFLPTIGVVTNIGLDHLNRFSTYEGYIRAKEEMLQGLSYSGTVVLNADDVNIAKFDLTEYKGKILKFGLSNKADFMAENIRIGNGGMEFTLLFHHIAYEFFVPGYGKHNVYNALAAVAAAHSFGVGVKESRKLLRSFRHLEAHTNILKGLNGSEVIDDTWSSNPTSFEAALEVLNDLANGRKKIVVLGRMESLGEFAQELYENVSRQIVNSRIDVLITKGFSAKDFAKYAIDLGLKKKMYTYVMRFKKLWRYCMRSSIKIVFY